MNVRRDGCLTTARCERNDVGREELGSAGAGAEDRPWQASNRRYTLRVKLERMVEVVFNPGFLTCAAISFVPQRASFYTELVFYLNMLRKINWLSSDDVATRESFPVTLSRNVWREAPGGL